MRILIAEDDALAVRNQINRDLHDGPTQLVAAMAMNIEFIQKLIHALPVRVEDELKALQVFRLTAFIVLLALKTFAFEKEQHNGTINLEAGGRGGA